MATAVANPPSFPQPKAATLAISAAVMLVLAVLLLAGAAGVVFGFLRAASEQRAADNGWIMATGVVMDKRAGQFAYVPDPADPTTTIASYQITPQVQVEYELNGQVQSGWFDVPTGVALDPDLPHHHNIAEGLLARFHRGDHIACYIDPADGTNLRLAQGDGGRRTTIAGWSLAGLLCIPALGLVIASGLLWRLSRAAASKPRPLVAVSR